MAKDTAIGRDDHIREFKLVENFSCAPAQLFVILGDIAQWPKLHAPRILVRKEPTRVQVAFDDATRVNITFDRGEEPGTAQLTFHHELHQDVAQVRAWRSYWRQFLKQLRSRVEL